MSPTLDEANAHEFFNDNWLKLYASRDELLHEIGVMMLAASKHHDVYWDNLDNCKELEWFIAYYAHHSGHHNDME